MYGRLIENAHDQAAASQADLPGRGYMPYCLGSQRITNTVANDILFKSAPKYGFMRCVVTRDVDKLRYCVLAAREDGLPGQYLATAVKRKSILIDEFRIVRETSTTDLGMMVRKDGHYVVRNWEGKQLCDSIFVDRGTAPISTTAFIPMVMKNGSPCEIENGTLYGHACAGAPDVIPLRNKPPVWNPKRNAFQLDFSGRAISRSVKNFQMTCQPICE